MTTAQVAPVSDTLCCPVQEVLKEISDIKAINEFTVLSALPH